MSSDLLHNRLRAYPISDHTHNCSAKQITTFPILHLRTQRKGRWCKWLIQGNTKYLVEGWDSVPKPAFFPCSMGWEEGRLQAFTEQAQQSFQVNRWVVEGACFYIETQVITKRVQWNFVYSLYLLISLFEHFIVGNDLHQKRPKFNMKEPPNLRCYTAK